MHTAIRSHRLQASITKLALYIVVVGQQVVLLVEAEQRSQPDHTRWQVDHDGNMCVNQDPAQGLADAHVPVSSATRCEKQRASLLQLGSNVHMQLPFDSGEDPKQPQAATRVFPREAQPSAAKVVVREESPTSESVPPRSQPAVEDHHYQQNMGFTKVSSQEEPKSMRSNATGLPSRAQDSKKEDAEVGYPRGTVAAMMLVTEIVYKGARSGVRKNSPSLTVTVVVVFVGAAFILLSIVRVMRGDDDKRVPVPSTMRRATAPPAPHVAIRRAPAPTHPVSPHGSYVSSKAPSMRQLGPTFTSQSISASITPPAYTTGMSSRQVEPIARATSPRLHSQPRLQAPQQQREITPLIASRHLCPGLVVPSGNECILAVPTLRHVGIPPRDRAAFNIQDLDGKSVIQAEVVAPRWVNIQASGIERHPMLVLRAGLVPGSGGKAPAPLLAYCKAGQEAGQRRNVYIYDARDELFAHISKDRNFSDRYVLTSGRIGLQLIFQGDFGNRSIHVTNERQQLLSETETCRMSFDPSGSYYKLRVVADVDVGLMLCALIAIDHMELP